MPTAEREDPTLGRHLAHLNHHSGMSDGKGPAENNPNATVKIPGRFKHHGKKAVGTFRMRGAAAGCSELDRGAVHWSANQR